MAFTIDQLANFTTSATANTLLTFLKSNIQITYQLIDFGD